MRKIALFIAFLFVSTISAWSQCAMCRTQLENNYSNGNAGIAANLNTGILYLLAMPYIAIFLIGFFWYKSSKNAQKSNRSLASR